MIFKKDNWSSSFISLYSSFTNFFSAPKQNSLALEMFLVEFYWFFEGLIWVNALPTLVHVTLEVAEELLPHLSIVRQRLLLIILNHVLHALLLQHSVVSLRHILPLICSELRQGHRTTLLLPNSCNEVACATKAWRSSTWSQKRLFLGGQQIARVLEGCIRGICIRWLLLVVTEEAGRLVEGT